MWKAIREEDIVKVLSDTGSKFLYILNAEDVIYDYRGYGTVATVTLGSSTRVTDIEPKTLTSPYESLYRMKVGIDVGMGYVELLAGTSRRGTSILPKPTSSNYYVGYFNEFSSPYEDPHFKMATMYNYVPAFAVYNPHGMTITPYISFRGTKYDTINLNTKEAAGKLGISEESLNKLLGNLKLGAEKRVPHRIISLIGTMVSGGT